MKNLNRLLSKQLRKEKGLDLEDGFSPGKTLKRLREEREVKQKEIYENANLNQAHISNMESGQRHPDFDLLLIYSEALKMDYYKLLSAILADYRAHLQQKAENLEKIITEKLKQNSNDGNKENGIRRKMEDRRRLSFKSFSETFTNDIHLFAF